MPGRCTLALFYEYFRIEKPVVTIMALQGLYHIRYKAYGEKNLEGFWEAWKEVVRKIGNFLKESTLTQELMRRLSQSHVLKHEIDAYRRDVPDAEEWEWDCVARIVAQKITDIKIKARADDQLRHAGIDPGGGFKGGPPTQGGGGGHGGRGGGKAGGGNERGKANSLTPDQVEAKRIQDAANNKAWQLAQNQLEQQQWSQGGAQPQGQAQHQQQYVQQWDANMTSRPNGKQRVRSAKKWWTEYAAGGGNQSVPPAASPGQPIWHNGQWMVPAAAPQQQAATGGSPATPANASLSVADLALKAQVKDLCYHHQGHFNSLTCEGYPAGTCKKRHELAPSKRADAFIPVPQEVQQQLKKHLEECNRWGVASSDPIQAANTKGKNGGGKRDSNGGKPKCDGKATDANPKGKAPGGGWPPSKGGKPKGAPAIDTTKGKLGAVKGGGGCKPKGGGRGEKGKRSRSQTGAYFGNADQYYDANNTGADPNQSQGVWVGDQFMVPAVQGQQQLQGQQQPQQPQHDGAEWTELDQQNIDQFVEQQEMSSTPGIAVPWQDQHGQWYLPVAGGQFAQTMRSPGGPAVAEQYDTGADERHPAKVQELGADGQTIQDDWFTQEP